MSGADATEGFDAQLLMRFLPPSARAHSQALLQLRDSLLASFFASDDVEVCRLRLAWWQQALVAAEAGQTPQHPALLALASGAQPIAWPLWQHAVQALLAALDANSLEATLAPGEWLWRAIAGHADDNALGAGLCEAGRRWFWLSLLLQDRQHMRWFSLADSARWQLSRRDLRALYTHSADLVSLRMLKSLASHYAQQRIELKPLTDLQAPLALLCGLQQTLDRRWLLAIARRPLAILTGHSVPLRPSRVFACWHTARHIRRLM
jgi:hypothetical protein